MVARKINWPVLLDFYYGAGSAAQMARSYEMGLDMRFFNLTL